MTQIEIGAVHYQYSIITIFKVSPSNCSLYNYTIVCGIKIIYYPQTTCIYKTYKIQTSSAPQRAKEREHLLEDLSTF